MWIFLSDSFLSIVHDPDPAKPRNLLVRARVKGDIERVFPGALVKRTPERDYLFRASIRNDVVANAIQSRISNIDYGNFKDSVDEEGRHNVYFSVWHTMFTRAAEMARKRLRPQQRPMQRARR